MPILYILAQQASTCSESILEILENTRDTKRCEIFSKLTIKTSEQRYWHHTFSSVSIVNFELANACWKVPTFPSIIHVFCKATSLPRLAGKAILTYFKSLLNCPLDLFLYSEKVGRYLSKAKNKGTTTTSTSFYSL